MGVGGITRRLGDAGAERGADEEASDAGAADADDVGESGGTVTRPFLWASWRRARATWRTGHNLGSMEETDEGSGSRGAASFELRPVGWVRSPLRSIEDAPCQGVGAPPARIDVEAWTGRCWRELEVGDEIFVLTWLDRADRSVLTTHPEDDESIPLTGVFSTRSPDRPNPIGLHRTTVVARGPHWIEVANIEALDGTPVVDVKPVIVEEGPGR